jgi:hypothetical protein
MASDKNGEAPQFWKSPGMIISLAVIVGICFTVRECRLAANSREAAAERKEHRKKLDEKRDASQFAGEVVSEQIAKAKIALNHKVALSAILDSVRERTPPDEWKFLNDECDEEMMTLRQAINSLEQIEREEKQSLMNTENDLRNLPKEK